MKNGNLKISKLSLVAIILNILISTVSIGQCGTYLSVNNSKSGASIGDLDVVGNKI
ncbi:MAG: hypothetical protein ACOVOV_20625 [Dolichospermum sp.]